MFDRDALVAALADSGRIYRVGAGITNATDGSETSGINSIEDWDNKMNAAVSGNEVERTKQISAYTKPAIADEVMPFDITISMANEYGKAAVLVIYGVEILNEGMQMSIDTLQSQKACTFVARRIKALRAVAKDGKVYDNTESARQSA